MKKILQEIFIYSFSLYATSLVFPGLKIAYDLRTIVIGGIILAIGYTIIRPILNIISLPFNFITFGLLSFLTSAFMLFVITIIYPAIKVVPFNFPGFSFLGIHLEKLYISGILSYVIISVTIYIISSVFTWLFE